MAAALEFLEAQGATRPELAECYTALADLYQRKLWHQLTLKLDQFLALAVVQAGDALIQLYNHFISDFETKINLLKFAHFTVVVSRQYLDKDAAVNYLEGVISKLHDTQEARVEEPILYVKMQIATFLLEKGNQKGCKKLLEEDKATLDSMVGIDPSVHGTYYWVCSQYHKAHQDYCEFYKSALLYLAYTTVESLSEQFKQNLAFDLSLAALLGENVYNFGELLAHPIIQSLLGTQAEWIFHMLQAFNSARNVAAAAAAAEAASQTAAEEKATLEKRVADLQQDLSHYEADLKTANNQVCSLSTKLQEATDEGTRLRKENSQMARKIQGIRIARTTQAAKLAEKAQEVVAAELKLHEMSETAKDLADQLSKIKAELEDSRKAQHETEEALKKNILDHAKLGRHVDMILTEVGVPPVQMPPQVLGDRLNLLPGFVKERELSTSQQVMHRVLSMFSSLYQGLDLQALSGGWAPGYSNEELDKIEEDCAALAQAIADTAMKDLELIPKDTPEDGFGPSH